MDFGRRYTVDVEEYGNAEDAIEATLASGVKVSEWARGLLRKAEFGPPTRKTIEVVIVQVEEFDSDDDDHYLQDRQIIEMARKLGLGFLAPGLVASLCGLVQKGQQCAIAMEVVKAENRIPSILYVDCKRRPNLRGVTGDERGCKPEEYWMFQVNEEE